MSTVFSFRIRLGSLSLLLLSILFAGSTSKLSAQVIASGVQRTVGGVSIDANGLLDNAQLDALGELAKLRTAAMGKTPDGLKSLVEMRKVSLRGLEAAIAECVKNNQPLPDEIKYLAGLQRIQYVFVYPENKDIVLAGPGEGWKVDARGNVVGLTTGRPVLLLDDLLVALRSATQASQGGISCSIDPTQEGMKRLNQLMSGIKRIANPEADKKAHEDALGLQQITIAGVPGSSHFARALVAADYRMKRIGMGFEPAPESVKLPSYMQMVSGTSGSTIQTPRWWMEPKFDAIVKDASGMAWELRGSSVQTLTEEDVFNAQGERKHTGKANSLSKKWADAMTKEYSALAVAEPVFGDLQNCMELAVVSALIVKERLTEKAGNSLPELFATGDVKTEEYNVPKQVASQANLMKTKKGNWLISVSGGVSINSWGIADKAQENDAVADIRSQAAAKSNAAWWWN
jgi:hypothetical protein